MCVCVDETPAEQRAVIRTKLTERLLPSPLARERKERRAFCGRRCDAASDSRARDSAKEKKEKEKKIKNSTWPPLYCCRSRHDDTAVSPPPRS